MRIIDPRVEERIRAGTPLKLDLGAGCCPRPGYFGVDRILMPSTAILADLSFPLDLLPESCASHIYSRHTLEHVENIVELMQEIYRISAPNCTIELIVPHFSNSYGYSDPTHVRVFGIYAMYYFSPEEHQPRRKVPSYYSRSAFSVEKIRIAFYRYSLFDRIMMPVVEQWVNRSLYLQEFYERRLSGLLRAWEVRFALRPIKIAGQTPRATICQRAKQP